MTYHVILRDGPHILEVLHVENADSPAEAIEGVRVRYQSPDAKATLCEEVED